MTFRAPARHADFGAGHPARGCRGVLSRTVPAADSYQHLRVLR